jgi:hypothetical protein
MNGKLFFFRISRGARYEILQNTQYGTKANLKGIALRLESQNMPVIYYK